MLQCVIIAERRGIVTLFGMKFRQLSSPNRPVTRNTSDIYISVNIPRYQKMNLRGRACRGASGLETLRRTMHQGGGGRLLDVVFSITSSMADPKWLVNSSTKIYLHCLATRDHRIHDRYVHIRGQRITRDVDEVPIKLHGICEMAK